MTARHGWEDELMNGHRRPGRSFNEHLRNIIITLRLLIQAVIYGFFLYVAIRVVLYLMRRF